MKHTANVDPVTRTANLIAEAALRHLEVRLPAGLRGDVAFMGDLHAAARAAVERDIDRRAEVLDPLKEDPRLGKTFDSMGAALNDLSVEERQEAQLLAERAISTGKLTDPAIVVAAWDWAHDSAIRRVRGRVNGSRP